MHLTYSALPPLLYDVTRQIFSATSGACAITIDPRWATHQTIYHDQTATIESCAWHTPQIAWARATLLRVGDQSTIFSLLAFPNVHYDLPLLGAEVVCVRESIPIAVMDWIPISAERDYLEPLAMLRRHFDYIENDTHIPAWAAALFSPFVFFVRPRAQAIATITATDILDFWQVSATDYVRLCAETLPHGDPYRTWKRQYAVCVEEQTQTPGGAMLARLFGADWASSYAHAVLFRPGGLSMSDIFHSPLTNVDSLHG